MTIYLRVKAALATPTFHYVAVSAAVLAAVAVAPAVFGALASVAQTIKGFEIALIKAVASLFGA